MLHFGVVLREGDYVVVGRDGLQVGFVGRHISPEGLFGHLTTAMSLRNGGGTGLLGSLCILYVFRLRFDMDFGRLSSNGKGFVCYCFAGVTVKEDA